MQQLFYESAKCLHGRMTQFRGKYYGSLFVHYQVRHSYQYHRSSQRNVMRVCGVLAADGPFDLELYR